MKRTMSRKSQIIYFLFLRFTGVEEMRDIRFPKDDLIPTINKLIETEPKHRVFFGVYHMHPHRNSNHAMLFPRAGEIQYPARASKRC